MTRTLALTAILILCAIGTRDGLAQTNPNPSVSGVGPIGTTGPITGMGPIRTGPVDGVGGIDTGNKDIVSPYQMITISRADCLRLAANLAPGGDANYQPGVGSGGKPVAPADLGGPSPLGQIVIPLTLPLGNYAKNLPSGMDQSQIYTGNVTVDLQTGQVLMNGQPMDSNSQSLLSQACRDRLAQ